MGYTHYWKLPKINKKTWAKIQAAAKEIVTEVPNLLQDSFDTTKPPVVGPDIIQFNGKGQDGHETFYVQRSDPGGFNFCKTARKPYDKAVTAVLCVVGHYLTKEGALKKPYSISSDGFFSEDWLEGRELAVKVLGEKLAFRPDYGAWRAAQER